MRPVRREEILDVSTYERARAEIRAAVLEAKRSRASTWRGAHVPLRERRDRRYQVQEMIRAERMTRRAETSGTSSRPTTSCSEEGRLGVSRCSSRSRTPPSATAGSASGSRCRVTCISHSRTAGGSGPPSTAPDRHDRLSSVQYLKFDVGGGRAGRGGRGSARLVGRGAARRRAARGARGGPGERRADPRAPPGRSRRSGCRRSALANSSRTANARSPARRSRCSRYPDPSCHALALPRPAAIERTSGSMAPSR